MPLCRVHGRVPRVRSAMLPDATVSPFGDPQPDSEHARVILAKVALETAQTASKWNAFLMRVLTMILIVLAVVVGQSAITNNWLKEFVRNPLQALISTGFTFITVVAWRAFVWLEGRFKEVRTETKELRAEVRAEIKEVRAEIKEVRVEIKEGNQAMNQRFDSLFALIINTRGEGRSSPP